MKHLGTLRIVNLILAALLGLAALFFFGASAFFAVSVPSNDESRLILVGSLGALGALWVFFAVFAWILADKVVDAEWRIPQTLMALLQVASFPLGTLYALYALWVCWINEPTKSAFDSSHGAGTILSQDAHSNH